MNECPQCDSLNTRIIDACKAECLDCGEIFIRQYEEYEQAA